MSDEFEHGRQIGREDREGECQYLRAEIERLREGRDTMGNLWAKAKEENAELRAEVERLRAAAVWHYDYRACLEAEVERLRALVQCLIDNDPDELIADNGMTVLDQWRKDARRALEGK